MDMDIIVGRESGVAQPRLTVKVGGTTKFIGTPGSVPKSVSRSHCRIEVDECNNIKVSNVADQNTLYINGLEYKSKTVVKSDLIELGADRYVLDLNAVLESLTAAPSPAPAPKNNASVANVYDISPLKKVWDEYSKARLNMQIKERKVNALSAIPGVLSMVSIALSFVEGLRGVFITVAAVFALSFALIRFKSAANVPLLQKELDEKFQDDYICPHCSHFLGNQRYELVLKNGVCPRCKSKFKE